MFCRNWANLQYTLSSPATVGHWLPEIHQAPSYLSVSSLIVLLYQILVNYSGSLVTARQSIRNACLVKL